MFCRMVNPENHRGVLQNMGPLQLGKVLRFRQFGVSAAQCGHSRSGERWRKDATHLLKILMMLYMIIYDYI
jgi:hypothetical protein